MRKSLLSYVAALAAVTAIACGELTGPESPWTPTDVVATLASPTSVNLSWTPSPQSDGVINYSVYRNGTKVGETAGTETTFTDTGLSPQTTYVYSVAANCVGGVISDRSVETEASTVTTIDITPPTIVQVIPIENTNQVSPAADVNVIFSEPMDPTTINTATFTIRVGTGAPLPATVTYNAETRRAVLVPTGGLPNFATITATMSTGAKDLAGNALQAAKVWTFTTRDDVPPTVISTNPVNGATGVPPGSVVTITFSENMDPGSINASNITLRPTASGTAVTTTVTYNTTTRVATITPSAPLTQNVAYTVTVGTGVRDAQGNAIAQTTFAFTVGDTTAPSVVSTVPADNATGVALNSTVTATFSEAMDPATINTTTFTVRPTSGGGNLAGTVTYNAGTNTATFTPSAPLAGGTSYTATVTTGARDASGNPMGAAKTWTFTTVDVVPPQVSGVQPANLATGVATSTMVRVTFNEPMDVTTITNVNIVLRNTLTSAVVPATVTYDAATRVATLTPTGPLSNLTNYTLNVTTGVKDASGNALASQFSSSFTTAAAPDNTAPTIVSRSPSNGATSQAINTNVTVTFSEPMDPATINTTTISLAPTSGGSAVAANVSYDAATNTATLNPTADLAYNTSYTLTITTGVKDVAGNSLAAQSTSTFTTIQDTVAPTVTARTPTQATGVPANSDITITFSEAMNASTISGSSFTLNQTSGAGSPDTVTGAISYDAATRTATFNPSGNLVAGGGYTVTVTTGAQDLAGNALTGNFTFSFTVAP